MSREVLVAASMEPHVAPSAIPATPVPESSQVDQSAASSTNETSAADVLSPSNGEVVDLSTAETNQTPPQSPSVREIHKNSWLKKMPCVEKWSGRFSKAQKPEKFWVVFCVHDDKDAFLEFYENRRSAYSHKPLSNVSLSQCLHISPTIVVQENDHEFVITLDTQVIRLAASTREQMLEWMDTMKTKLRELGVLEPKDNLYSKEPITGLRTPSLHSSLAESLISLDSQGDEDNQANQNPFHSDVSRLSLRDPNSPLPPVPADWSHPVDVREGRISMSTVVYVRNPSSAQPAAHTVQVLSNPVETNEIEESAEGPSALPSESNSIFSFDLVPKTVSVGRHVHRSDSSVSQDSILSLPSPSSSAFSVPNTPVSAQSSVYEPLFYPSSLNTNQQIAGIGIRNPNYEHPPTPQRRSNSESAPVLPPRVSSEQRRMSSSTLGEMQQEALVYSRNRGLSNLASTSEPSLNVPSQSIGTNSSGVPQRSFEERTLTPSLSSSNRILLHQGSSPNVTARSAQPPLEEGPPPYNIVGNQSSNQRNSQTSNISADGPSPVDEMGRPLSLREVQVLKLQGEILHKSGVRLVLRKKDCINAVAFVECFGSVWVAGWKQKEHPLLHNTFHIGDRIISVAGHQIHNIQEAHKAIKHQPLIVEFIVRRTPYGKVLALKREYEGQDLGIVREGGTAEIKEVKSGGLASRHGLLTKAPSVDGNSLCNWVLTEVNHRPLNLFFKDNEVQDRLNAVGLDISILVQPIDLVKALKKQLKALRGYKDYIIQ